MWLNLEKAMECPSPFLAKTSGGELEAGVTRSFRPQIAQIAQIAFGGLAAPMQRNLRNLRNLRATKSFSLNNLQMC